MVTSVITFNVTNALAPLSEAGTHTILMMNNLAA
jgi:hypothetical protein